VAELSVVTELRQDVVHRLVVVVVVLVVVVVVMTVSE
jgi:hypothetical protein